MQKLYIIVAIFILAVAGYYYYTPETNGPVVLNDAEQDSVMEDAAMEDAVDTSNWQTYRNEEYGFEFRYPSEVSLREISGGEFDHFISLVDAEGELSTMYVDANLKDLTFDHKLGAYIYDDSGVKAIQEHSQLIDDSGVSITTVHCLQPLFNNTEILAIRSHYPPLSSQFTQTVSFIAFINTGIKIRIQSPWFQYEKPAKAETVEMIVQNYINRASPIFSTLRFIGNAQLIDNILCRIKERG